MPRIRVVKVGGSLLDLPDLSARMRTSLASRDNLLPDRRGCATAVEPHSTRDRSEVRNVLIPGGGALADCIRRYDATFQFQPRFIHEIAIETMRVTARLLAELLDVPLVDDIDVAAIPAPLTVLDVDKILKREPHAEGVRLNAEWSVTSDSISARVATMIGADELWLLKSVAAADKDAQSLASEGVVDPEFPRYAKNLRWRVINLRGVRPNSGG